MTRVPLLLLFLAAPAAAQGPPPPPPPVPQAAAVTAATGKLPRPSNVPPVEKPLPPDTPVRLTKDLLYVFDFDVPVMVITSPAGVLSATREDGPIKVKGRFADDPTRTQTRTFAGKSVWTVEPAAEGVAELIVFPVGTTDPSAVQRQMIDTRIGPRPPPKPDDPVDPPKPPAGPLAAKFQAAYTADPAADKAASLAALILSMDAAVTSANVASLTDAGALDGKVRADTIARVGRGKLPAVGLVVAEYMAGVLPTDPTARLTAEVRAQAATAYAAVAAALREVNR